MDERRDKTKSILISDGKGNFATYSTEETLAKGLNKFEGWMCAAGSESMHVCPNGAVLLAACRIQGIHGNVYDNSIKLPKKWVTCTKSACMCGGDMQVRKAESVRYYQRSRNPLPRSAKQVEELQSMKWVSPYHFQDAHIQPKMVSWDMGKRCNFSCSYCPPQISNQVDPLRTWGELKAATDTVIESFAKGKKIKWVITGGEPTIIPAYLDWVDYVYDKGHLVHTTTNGSRGPKYLEKLIEKSSIGFSLHLEYLDMDRLVESCERVSLKIKEGVGPVQENWFGVRVMVAPGDQEKAMLVKDRLLSIQNFRDYGHFFLSPIHEYRDVDEFTVEYGELSEYAPEELVFIQNHT